MTGIEEPLREPNRPLLGASVAVFRDGKVLLAQRSLPPLQGLWSLPGGKVELGETLHEAALRELMEETGVEARIVDTAGHVDIISREESGGVDRHFVVIAFAALHVAGEPMLGEGTADVRWVPLEEIESLPLTPGAADIVRKAAELARDRDIVGSSPPER